jgi:hypothetical protein
MKWRCILGVLCDHRIPIKLKRKFYKIAIRLAMLYGINCWAIKKQHIHKMSVTEILKIGVAPLDEKIGRGQLLEIVWSYSEESD